MTLFIVAVLDAFEPFPQMQIPLAILAASIQIIMPASLTPYRAALEHTISLAGGVTFFIIDILQLARFLASQQQNVLVLAGNAGSAMSVEEQLAGLDMIVNATLVLSGTGLTYLVLYELLKETQIGMTVGRFYAFLRERSMSCCMCIRNKDRVRVLPSAAAAANKKPLRGSRKEGKAESRKSGREAALDILTRMPRRLVVRPRQGILDRVPDRMIQEYVAALEVVVDQLSTLHAVSMQAAWRGHSVRHVTRQQSRAPGHVDDENKSSAGPHSRPMTLRAAQSIRQQRAIVDVEEELNVPPVDDEFEQNEDSTMKVVSAASTATRRRLARRSSQFAAMKMQAMARGAMLDRVSKEGAKLRQDLKRERTIRRGRLQSQILDEAEAKKILADDASVHAAHLESLEAEREQLRAGQQRRFLEKRWVAVLRKHTSNKDVLKLSRSDLVAALQGLFHDIDAASAHTDGVDGTLCRGDLVHVLENMMGRGRTRSGDEKAGTSGDDAKKNHEIAERMMKAMLAAVEGGDGEHITEAQFIAFFVAIAERQSSRRQSLQQQQ